MNRKQRKTLADIFAEPVKRNIAWRDVVSLIKALDGGVLESAGSRVRFDIDELSVTVHRPHPGNELKVYQVKALRAFLEAVGVEPA